MIVELLCLALLYVCGQVVFVDSLDGSIIASVNINSDVAFQGEHPR